MIVRVVILITGMGGNMNNHITKYAFGITSKTADDKHIYMADIDEDISLENVIDIAQLIIKQLKLSNMFIIDSSTGYNLLSIDKLSLKIIYLTNKRFPSIDQLYNELQYYKRGFFTLRIADDKKIVWIHTGKGIWIRSDAHRRFLNNQFNINIKKNGDTDNNNMIRFIRFKNMKHGVVSYESSEM